MTGCRKVSVLLIVILSFGTAQMTSVVGLKKVFTQCGLARELFKLGMPKYQLDDWVCLVKSESGGDTSCVSGPNHDGSYDYGLFQINSRYWCGLTSKSGTCHVRCSDLLTLNIAESVACAKLIYRTQSFEAWYGWRDKCKNRLLPDVLHCLKEKQPSMYSVIMNELRRFISFIVDKTKK